MYLVVSPNGGQYSSNHIIHPDKIVRPLAFESLDSSLLIESIRPVMDSLSGVPNLFERLDLDRVVLEDKVYTDLTFLVRDGSLSYKKDNSTLPII